MAALSPRRDEFTGKLTPPRLSIASIHGAYQFVERRVEVFADMLRHSPSSEGLLSQVAQRLGKDVQQEMVN